MLSVIISGGAMEYLTLHTPGHFALETHGPEIAALIRDFLGRTLK